MTNTTGDKIRIYLENRGIKQVFVANRAGISEKKFSALINGRTRVQVEDLKRICNALNLQPAYFLQEKTEDEGGARQ